MVVKLVAVAITPSMDEDAPEKYAKMLYISLYVVDSGMKCSLGTSIFEIRATN